MKIIRVKTALKRLPKLNNEIRYRSCIETSQFTAGLIAFRPTKESAAKQILHKEKDVVCHVLKGRGRLRVNGRRIDLGPGTLCHIPKGTPHDFAAKKNSELILFYSMIKTR